MGWDGMGSKTGSKTGSKRHPRMTYAGPIQALPGDHIQPRRHLSLCVYVYGRVRLALAGSMPLRSPMPPRHALTSYWPSCLGWPLSRLAQALAWLNADNAYMADRGRGVPLGQPRWGGGCIYIGPPHKFFAQNDLMPYMQSNGEPDSWALT